jgi:hypothetical protein
VNQHDLKTRSCGPLEALEGRTLFSADLLSVAPASVLGTSGGGADELIAAPRLPLPATAQSPYPQVVGVWIGTCKTVGKKRPTEIAMRITRQTDGSATGKFALGPATTWHKVLSTAVLSADRSRGFRVILPGDGFYGSMNATVSRDGSQIVGRWTCNSGGEWKSGTLVLNRQ